jgi:ferredoxin
MRIVQGTSSLMAIQQQWLLMLLLLLSSQSVSTASAFQQQHHHTSTPGSILSSLSSSGGLSTKLVVKLLKNRRLSVSSSLSLQRSSGNNDDVTTSGTNGDGRIDTSVDERLYRIRLSRAPGIDWGTDLSFAFVYVRGVDPTGEASASGRVNVGDQLCELIPVQENAKPINLLGASFDFVMTSLASMDKSVSEMDLVFFRGTKQELKVLCNDESAKSESSTITVTVIENKGSSQEKLTRLQAPRGVNVRELLVDNGINVYQSITRWTNCKGKQLCGTCIVNVADGLPNTNWKSMDEASTLRSNPDSYRLSCVTFAHGDITVETFPPINADQWTR